MPNNINNMYLPCNEDAISESCPRRGLPNDRARGSTHALFQSNDGGPLPVLLQ